MIFFSPRTSTITLGQSVHVILLTYAFSKLFDPNPDLNLQFTEPV